ncbi:hypothetical protein GC169_12085 [bacterium]|nr:hypothetical protein [bacterium]
MLTVPMAIYWLAAIWALSRKGVGPMLYVLMMSIPFGALAVIPPTMTGGMSLLATSISAVLLFAKVVLREGTYERVLANALSFRRMGLLTLFLIVTIVVTLVAPRLFAGAVRIVPYVWTHYGSLAIGWLYPSSQNISQLLYLCISVFAVFIFVEVLRQAPLRQTFLKAMFWGGVTMLVTGVVDVAGGGAILETARTASYDYLIGAEVAGVKRITGAMSEASSFGEATLFFGSSIWFLRHAMQDAKMRTRWAPLVAVALILFSFSSTSSAAYVGCGLFGILAMLDWGVRAGGLLGRKAGAPIPLEALVAAVTIAAAFAVLAFTPAILNPLIELIDEMVFSKTTSWSFIERSHWTNKSLEAFFATWGMGVGAGSTLSSNWFVAVLASTGVFGTAALFGFFAQMFTRRGVTDEAAVIAHAVRMIFLPWFGVSLLIGTIPDFGIKLSALFGLTLAVTMRSRTTPEGVPRFASAGIRGEETARF